MMTMTMKDVESCRTRLSAVFDLIQCLFCRRPDREIGTTSWPMRGRIGPRWPRRNLFDPASSHMLVSKIKPCMSQYKQLNGETANGS